MTTLQRIGEMLDAFFLGAKCDFWGRDLVVALSPRLMLAAIIHERSEQRIDRASRYVIHVTAADRSRA